MSLIVTDQEFPTNTNQSTPNSQWNYQSSQSTDKGLEQSNLIDRLKIQNIQMFSRNVLIKKIDEFNQSKSGIYFQPSEETMNKNFLANDTFVAEVIAVWEECIYVKPWDIIYGNKLYVKGINVENITTSRISQYGIVDEKGGISWKLIN
jgi:hypothetical protein